MKTTFSRSFLIIAFLFLDFVAFAQLGQTAENEDYIALESNDAPAAPINGKLIWLAVMGLIFAYYTFKKRNVVIDNK